MSPFIRDFEAFIRTEKINVFRIGEMREGVVETLDLIPTPRALSIFSVAKAFTVTALGMLYDKGLFHPDMLLTDIFGDLFPKEADARLRNATAEDALTQHMGFPSGALDIDHASRPAFGDDFLRAALTTPLVCAPRTDYHYTDAAYYILARAAEILGKEPLDTMLEREFFLPFRCAEVAFTKCPQGHFMGCTGMYTDILTMLKLGELYRCGGVLEGKRLLSEEWVMRVLSHGYELRPKCEGLAFGKAGMMGQMLLVIPREHRVVAWQGYHSRNKDLIEFAARYEGA